MELCSVEQQNDGAQKAKTIAKTETTASKVPDTYIDERCSYCESCDTYKKGVQHWTTSFETSKPPGSVARTAVFPVRRVAQSVRLYCDPSQVLSRLATSRGATARCSRRGRGLSAGRRCATRSSTTP